MTPAREKLVRELFLKKNFHQQFKPHSNMTKALREKIVTGKFFIPIVKKYGLSNQTCMC